MTETETRIVWIRRVLSVSFLLALFFGSGLWIVKPLLLPKVPVLEGWNFSYSLSVALYACLIVLCAFVFFYDKAVIYGGVLLLCAILALEDQLRWRVAFYIYVMVTVGLLFWSMSKDELRGPRLLLGLRLLFIGVYFWAGVHKWNPSFFASVFPWMLSGVLPDLLYESLAPMGVFIPFLECFFGIGLIFQRTRKLSVLAIVVTHIFILWCIGPFGHNWNPFVWPWNLAMASLVFTLFWDFSGRLLPRSAVWGLYSTFIVFLVGLLPSLNPLGYWDDYPSFHLYSGATPEASILGDHLEYVFPSQLVRTSGGQSKVSFTDWVTMEVGMTPYPSRRYYVSVFEKLCVKASTPLALEIHFRPRPFHPQRTVERLECAEPREMS